MAKESERGFFAPGIALPLWMAALLCLGAFFFQYMHMVLMEKADLELSEEIHTALQLIITDAMEAQNVRLLGPADARELRFLKAGNDLSGWRVTSYRMYEKDGLRKLYRGHIDAAGFQPLTGQSLMGYVALEEFAVEQLPNGLYHLRLSGHSLRTGHRVEQTAEFFVQEGHR